LMFIVAKKKEKNMTITSARPSTKVIVRVDNNKSYSRRHV